MPLYQLFFGGGPTKIDCRNKGTLSLASLLEDLVNCQKKGCLSFSRPLAVGTGAGIKPNSTSPTAPSDRFACCSHQRHGIRGNTSLSRSNTVLDAIHEEVLGSIRQNRVNTTFRAVWIPVKIGGPPKNYGCPHFGNPAKGCRALQRAVDPQPKPRRALQAGASPWGAASATAALLVCGRLRPLRATRVALGPGSPTSPKKQHVADVTNVGDASP